METDYPYSEPGHRLSSLQPRATAADPDTASKRLALAYLWPHLWGDYSVERSRAAARFAGARTGRTAFMANPVPAGSDVSAGTYRCMNCGYELEVGSTKHLPPCPECGSGEWDTRSGGDSVNDPYPNQH
jgi:Zinc-ribbon containing domain